MRTLWKVVLAYAGAAGSMGTAGVATSPRERTSPNGAP